MSAIVITLEDRRRARTGIAPQGFRSSTGAGGLNCGMNSTPSKVLNFQSAAAIAGGAQVTLVQTPQEAFKIARFIVPSSLALAFTIDAINVGTLQQNVAPGTGMLAQVASEINGGLEVCFDKVCEAGIQVALQVTNITGGALFFRATMTGEAVRTC